MGAMGAAAGAAAATTAAYPSGVPYGQEAIPLAAVPPFGPQGGASEQGEVATVVRPHIPQLSDELLLSPGDTVVIQKIHDDGWATGLVPP